ncbi:MAG: enolase C-terminal domain-like protein, partial [Anaerobacillus sp.]
EQPVLASDVEGLKKVTDAVHTPIMADESVFSPQDALNVIRMRASDLINIKLMKAGGIHQALKINALAESAGMECMVGSMIESRVGITAAAHFAASQKNVTRFDFDAPLMLKNDLVSGGVTYSRNRMILSEEHGLGIRQVKQGGITIGID